MANMLINDQELSDFVVAKGTSGIWRYIKYANGFAQCWAKYYSINEPYGGWTGRIFLCPQSRNSFTVLVL